MSIFYSIVVHFLYFVACFLSIFNKKVHNWINVRKNWKNALLPLSNSKERFIWIHCASAGEFEQAIPLINALKQKKDASKIAVSFFSISGFELYKNTRLADIFFYFPFDSMKNARILLRLLQPSKVIFIRKEIWLNILLALKEKSIPVFLVNANTQTANHFLYQYYLNKTLTLFTKVYSTSSYGNTKLEQVAINKNQYFKDDILEDFCRDSLVIILGSSWKTEEKMMAAFFHKRFKELKLQVKIIIAPHEYNEKKYTALTEIFSEGQLSGHNNVICYSDYIKGSKQRVLFLDKKGILKYAYRYGTIAFIGGGFDKSIHNLAEAAVYGLPTIFGPKFHKFEEANELISLQTAYSIKHYDEFELLLLKLLNDEHLRVSVKEKLDVFFIHQEHISEKIISDILT